MAEEERVEEILRRCDDDLTVLIDNISFALFQATKLDGRIEPYTKEALKKSLTAFIDCAYKVEKES